MADFLSMYSIQHWLESCPQGYLSDTEYGHPPGEKEPGLILDNELLREQTIRTTVQLRAAATPSVRRRPFRPDL